MKMEEIIARGLSINEAGKVLDEYGNEYRDESGSIRYVKEGE